jgi:hypothetical protein
MNRYCYAIKPYWEAYPGSIKQWNYSFRIYLYYNDDTIEMLSKPRKAKCNRSLTHYIVEGGLVKRYLGVRDGKE